MKKSDRLRKILKKLIGSLSEVTEEVQNLSEELAADKKKKKKSKKKKGK